MTRNCTETNLQVEEYMIPADPDLPTDNPEAVPDTEVPHPQLDWSEEEVCTGTSALEEDSGTDPTAEVEAEATQEMGQVQRACLRTSRQ